MNVPTRPPIAPADIRSEKQIARDLINPGPVPAPGPHAIIGESFRRSRQRLQLTLRDAAGLLDMTPARLSEIERGDAPPTIHDVWRLLDYATDELNAAIQTIKEMDGAA